MSDQPMQRPVWRQRPGPRGNVEFWRTGAPNGLTLSVWQPHGTYWRMYWGIVPVVRSEDDVGIFPTAFSAMEALDALAANGMRDALLD
jgi:hypothetical protein